MATELMKKIAGQSRLSGVRFAYDHDCALQRGWVESLPFLRNVDASVVIEGGTMQIEHRMFRVSHVLDELSGQLAALRQQSSRACGIGGVGSGGDRVTHPARWNLGQGYSDSAQRSIRVRMAKRSPMIPAPRSRQLIPMRAALGP